jgi:hypothetical protein
LVGALVIDLTRFRESQCLENCFFFGKNLLVEALGSLLLRRRLSVEALEDTVTKGYGVKGTRKKIDSESLASDKRVLSPLGGNKNLHFSEASTINGGAPSDHAVDTVETVTTSTELKAYLESIEFKLREEVAAPIFCVSAMNYVMNLPNIQSILSEDCKKVAQNIWGILKSKGLQVSFPPILS